MLTNGKMKDLDSLDLLSVKVIKNMMDANIPQWTFSYPRKEHFINDVIDSSLYLFKENGNILGCGVIKKENDIPYQEIKTWQGFNSLVIHRVLVDPLQARKGIAKTIILKAKELAKKGLYDSIKVDTHPENYKMRNLLEKNGFVERGYIKSINRIAYEYMMEDKL